MSEQVTVRTIVADYLREHGYDGLWGEDGECGCRIDDLCPCMGNVLPCQPGYESPCDCGEHHFHIGMKKPEKGGGG